MKTETDKRIQYRIKRVLDTLVALILFLLLLPLSILIGILIFIGDRGSVFFMQERIGYKGKVFRIIKFRTMVENADALLAKDGSAKGINRITPVGRFLRKTSLDEIPQLINILKGDMSFIGPRPSLVTHYRDRYTDEQRQRVLVKPGITGLAQINGRNSLKWSKRIEFDRQYILKYSLFLDFKILLKTVKIVLFGEGVKMDRNIEEVDDLPKARGKNHE